MDKTKNLIEDVISDLSKDVPIKSIGLKLQIIARQLKNNSFLNWTKNEIEGYSKSLPLPDYRIHSTRVFADILIDNGIKALSLKNHNMPIGSLGDEAFKKLSTIYIRDSIISLEQMSSSEKLAYSVTEHEKFLLSKIYENSTILNAHKDFQKSTCADIVYKFKSRLLDTLIDINDSIFDNEIKFDELMKAEEISKIVNQNIYAGIYSTGKNANINANNSTNVIGENTISISAEFMDEIKSLISKIENIISEVREEQEDVINEINRIKTQLGKEKPKTHIIYSAFETIKAILIGVASNLSTPFIVDSINEVMLKLK